jgi:hypothetical protein
MTVKERLTIFAKSQERSVRAFESKAGLNYGYINSIRVSIQPDKIKSIASNYVNLNVDWLLTGEGNMLRQTSLEPQKVAGKVEGPDAAYAEQRQQGLEKINEQDKTNLTNEVEMPFNDLIATIRYLSETVNNLQKKVDQLEYQNEKLRKNREGDQSLSEVG